MNRLRKKTLDKHLASVHQIEDFIPAFLSIYLLFFIKSSNSRRLILFSHFPIEIPWYFIYTTWYRFLFRPAPAGGRVGGEEPSTLVFFCLYQIVVECSHANSLVRSSRTVPVCFSFCTPFVSRIWRRKRSVPSGREIGLEKKKSYLLLLL